MIFVAVCHAYGDSLRRDLAKVSGYIKMVNLPLHDGIVRILTLVAVDEQSEEHI